MRRNVQLLIIDPQNDFCDLPEAWRPLDPQNGRRTDPALPVAGAHADMLRLARLVDEAAEALSGVVVTLDSHHRVDVAHPPFWRRGDGGPVAPFTQVTARQVRAGEFAPRDARALPRVLTYVDELEARGRYTLMVWPVHCEIGSWGHGVHAAVRAAYNRWEERRQTQVAKVVKGTNPWTEHYSAVQAEVPDRDDADTQLNRRLIDALDAADMIVVAGEAGSHCVKATTEHIADHLPGGRLERLVLLTDCMSPVGGFETQQAAFLEAMRARGARLATSTELLPELQAAA
ncbi:isochorismatase family protein [Schlegelella sp. S2-27]|uniref:Isochorismatase family protein n=1 Tax=Caldimonas mangrovi TaxID=2944811 RepID=A0ABT0YPD4_9BURK|nr:isochorismatase family protein [Caldimonas mangrovi]MCM5680603.1 isochorismatase family protein [Caldimonas mangrovi]